MEIPQSVKDSVFEMSIRQVIKSRFNAIPKEKLEALAKELFAKCQ